MRALVRLYQAARGALAGETSSNLFYSIAGNGFQSALGFISFTVVARALGPEGFGLFVLAFGAFAAAAQILDMGLNSAFTRYGAQADSDADEPGSARLLRACLESKLMLYVAGAALGLLLAGPFASTVLKEPKAAALLRWAVAASGVLSLHYFLLTALQAWQKFKEASLALAITAVVKLISAVLLWKAGLLSAGAALAVYMLSPLAGVFYALACIPAERISGVWAARCVSSETKKLWSFGGWMGVSAACLAVMGYLDVGTLSRFFGAAEVGLYAAGFRLASVFRTTVAALAAVFTQRASTFRDVERLKKYLEKSGFLAAAAAAAMPVLWFAAPPLIRGAFGNLYAGSIGIFQVLGVGMMIAAAATPFTSAFFAWDASRSIAGIALAQLACLAGLLLWLVPGQASRGAAWAFTLSQGIAFVLTLAVLRFQIRNMAS